MSLRKNTNLQHGWCQIVPQVCLPFLSIFFNIIIYIMLSFFFTESDREDYVKELEKYFPVHIYGRCGKFSCPENDAG